MILGTPLQHHVGEAYQVSPPSDIEYVRGMRCKCVFFYARAGIAKRRIAFQSSPLTCLVSNGDETWYASPTHEKNRISVEPTHMFSVEWGWNLVRLSNTWCWRGVLSFTPIRHWTCVRARPKCVFCLCTWGNCLEKKCISVETAHMFSVGWGWNLVRYSNTSCWRGVPSFIPIRHCTYAGARPKCVFFYAWRQGIAYRKVHFNQARAHV